MQEKNLIVEKKRPISEKIAHMVKEVGTCPLTIFAFVGKGIHSAI